MPASERSAYLESLRSADESIVTAVEELLSELHSGGLDVAAVQQDLAVEAAAWLEDEEAAAPMPSAIGPYRVVREIGRGGMGVVYLAHDERLSRRVALKSLPSATALDPRERARLAREARATAALSNPHVAAIYDLVEDSAGRLFLVLEHVPGETLRDTLDRQLVPGGDALRWCGQVASGVEAAHAAGLLHRDLKPSNVMITPQGAAKLLDFGLARRPDGDGRSPAAAGTPGYMSPEQIRGEPLDMRCDTWALGCVLFECLAGEPAFGGDSAAACQAATLDAEPPWDRLPASTPETVGRLLRSCLAKDLALRPASMEEVRRVLEIASSASLPARPTLPFEREPFVGRESDLAELSRRLLLDGNRCVTVLGLGGMGKTRLSLRFAWSTLDRWLGGTWFCDLSEARDEDGIAHAVGTALGVPLVGGDAVAQLGHAIASRGRCLVILDNFEQVASFAAATLGRWLSACEQASFLVTSRAVLGLPEETTFVLEPLTLPDAVALFDARARAARRGIEPSRDEGHDVDRLVETLDRLPLAIELAAARMRSLTVQQVRDRMSERFKLLTARRRNDRHARLEATLDWSWSLLSDWERAAMAQLSVFEGGFTLEAAEAVLDLEGLAGAPWTVDVVEFLLDKSLLTRGTEGRFGMLVSVHEYAAQRLQPRLDAERRHGAWFARMGTEGAMDLLSSHGGTSRRAALSRELDNLLAACGRAVARGDGPAAAAACRAAVAVLDMRGPYARGVELARAVLDMDGLGARERAVTLLALAPMVRKCGHVERSRAAAEAARAAACEAGDLRLEALALGAMGLADSDLGRTDDAWSELVAALDLAQQSGDRLAEANALSNIGRLCATQGRMEEARSRYEAALVVHREVGNRRGEAIVLGNLGLMHVARKDTEQARRLLEGALAIHEQAGDLGFKALALGNLGELASSEGRRSEAHERYEEALRIHRECGDRSAAARLIANIGLLHSQAGEVDAATERLEEALTLQGDGRHGRGIILGFLAEVERRQGLFDRARARFEEALAIHREARNLPRAASELLCLGVLHLDQGDTAAARRALDEALAITRETDDPRKESFVLCRLAAVAHAEGRDGEARETAERALALARDLGLTLARAQALVVMGDLHLAGLRLPEARECFEAAIALSRDIGHARSEAQAVAGLGEALLRDGDTVRSRARLEEAEAILRATSERLDLARVLCLRAGTDLMAGDRARAEAALAEAGRMAAEMRVTPSSRLSFDLERARRALQAAGKPP